MKIDFDEDCIPALGDEIDANCNGPSFWSFISIPTPCLAPVDREGDDAGAIRQSTSKHHGSIIS